VDAAQLWLHDLGSPTTAANLARELQSRGFVVREWSGACESAPGVVLFDACSPQLLDLVMTASDFGRERVLAIRCGAKVNRVDEWRLLEVGAADILDGTDTQSTAAAIAARVSKWRAIDDALAACPANTCVGKSLAWQRILQSLAEGVLYSAAPLLLTGESGTGKELIARLAHDLDRRADKKDLVIVDCTTLLRELSGSELFGHVRGAYTGALADRLGAFALADGGTLFLDEIGELPLTLQAELLRVVQEGTYKAVGSNVWKRTRFRLIAATHRDLEADIVAGRFRHDLYHRITGWRLELPPLHDRVEDLPLLAEHFLREFANGEVPALSPEVLDYLATHRFPGNVRQLRNIIQRMMVRYPGAGPITLGLIAPEDRPTAADLDSAFWLMELEKAVQHALASGVSLNELARQAKEAAVRVAVRNAEGNLQRAAKRLGVTDRTLQIRAALKRSDAPS
jgi:transcriptional regulator with GAF, ATPase, and Fis domain